MLTPKALRVVVAALAVAAPAIARAQALPKGAASADVRDFGAKGDGKADDTQALRAAIASVKAWQIVYLPAGTYLVSDRVDFTRFTTVRGDGPGKTIVRLADRASGFTDATKPRGVLRAIYGDEGGHNNVTHSIHVMHLTIDVGAGNAGAMALDFLSHNGGGIENVELLAPAGSGAVGLSLDREAPGPALVNQLVVRGFDVGISTRWGVYGMTFEDVTLEGQKVAGVKLDGQVVTMRHVRSRNAVPAITGVAKNYGLVTLLDSTLEGGATGRYGVELDGQAYLRNVESTGYAGVAKISGQPSGARVDELKTASMVQTFPSPDRSLQLPVKDMFVPTWDPPGEWVNVRSFAAMASNGDWTKAIQAAIDSGKPTIYFPGAVNSPYPCNGELHFHGAVRRIIGLEADFGDGCKLIFDHPDPKVTIYAEQIRWGARGVDVRGASTVVLRRTLSHGPLETFPGAGDLFIDDWCCSNLVVRGTKVWMRQLNEESKATVKLHNVGGTVWVLGYKTEMLGTLGRFEAGALTEIVGGLALPAQGHPTVPMYINDGATFTAIHREGGYYYETFVTETRDGKSQTLSPDFPRGMIFYATNPNTQGGVVATGGARDAGTDGAASEPPMDAGSSGATGSAGANGLAGATGSAGETGATGGMAGRRSGGSGGGDAGGSGLRAPNATSGGCAIARSPHVAQRAFHAAAIVLLALGLGRRRRR